MAIYLNRRQRSWPASLALVFALVFALACAGDRARSADSTTPQPSALVVRAPSSTTPIRWPADPMKAQLGDLSALDTPIPSCGEPAIIAGDSVGPLHVGRELSTVTELCPRAVALWELGDEAIPAPVLIVRFGLTRFELAFADTLSKSALTSIIARDTSARTREGIGPGSLFTDLTAAYGKPTLEEGECVLNVIFASHPGLSFRLDTAKQLSCEDIPDIATRNDVSRLPTITRVEAVTVYRRAPAT